jgi:thioredoxin reductase
LLRADFAVVGGSYARLASALQLARTRRDVTVIDAGLCRNRYVDKGNGTSHGLLSRDGAAPGEIAARARWQLQSYPGVRWIEGGAEDARWLIDGRVALPPR